MIPVSPRAPMSIEAKHILQKLATLPAADLIKLIDWESACGIKAADMPLRVMNDGPIEVSPFDLVHFAIGQLMNSENRSQQKEHVGRRVEYTVLPWIFE